MQLERKEIYKHIQPAIITDKSSPESTITSYDDAIRCLNLLADLAKVSTEIEKAYRDAAILYMYDIIDTLIARLGEADAARFDTK